MQYSQYCRHPTAKAGRAKHEIPARSGSQAQGQEFAGTASLRAPGMPPGSKLTGVAALALSELVRQRWNRRRKTKEQEGFAPSHSAAGESHLHLGKPVCRL